MELPLQIRALRTQVRSSVSDSCSLVSIGGLGRGFSRLTAGFGLISRRAHLQPFTHPEEVFSALATVVALIHELADQVEPQPADRFLVQRHGGIHRRCGQRIEWFAIVLDLDLQAVFFDAQSDDEVVNGFVVEGVVADVGQMLLEREIGRLQCLGGHLVFTAKLLESAD